MSFNSLSWIAPRQHEALHGIGKSFISEGRRHTGGLPLNLRARVAHRDAEPAALEHQDIVRLVTDRAMR